MGLEKLIILNHYNNKYITLQVTDNLLTFAQEVPATRMFPFASVPRCTKTVANLLYKNHVLNYDHIVW